MNIELNHKRRTKKNYFERYYVRQEGSLPDYLVHMKNGASQFILQRNKHANGEFEKDQRIGFYMLPYEALAFIEESHKKNINS